MAPAVTASLSVVGCSKTVSGVPSASLPTITPEAIPRSPLLTSPSVLIAVAPCGGSQPCHALATHSHSPVTRHDLPTHAHHDHARSQSCGQRCLHRHRVADQSLQSGMPTVPAPEIAATAAHSPRSPVPRANKPLSARTLQPRLNVKRQQAFATIPIVPTSRGFVQSGFYEVALTTRPPRHVLPRDLIEPSRFSNRSRHHSRWQAEGLPWARLFRCGRTIPLAKFAGLPSERRAQRLLAIGALLDGTSRKDAVKIGVAWRPCG